MEKRSALLTASACRIKHRSVSSFAALAISAALCVGSSAPVFAQEGPDRQQRYGNRDHDFGARLDRGTVIIVRTNQSIDADRSGDRIYTATVDRDVLSENDRIAIPRGSNVELTVRVARDNDLVLDIESVVVNGHRYAVRTEPNRVESEKDRSLVGSIVGAINGGQVRGREVHVPRGTELSFRLERPLELRDHDRDRR
jgi:hypothetical protein